MYSCLSTAGGWLWILFSHVSIYFCCVSCRSGTRQVRSASGRAWWSTTTAASMLSSSCTTWPASPPSRASQSGSRSAADTLWGPWCRASWWATSVTWGTAGRSPPRLRSVLLTATASRCSRRRPKTLPRGTMLTLSFWLWLIDSRATNPWDWSSWVKAGSCGTRESGKQELANAEVTSVPIWMYSECKKVVTAFRNSNGAERSGDPSLQRHCILTIMTQKRKKNVPFCYLFSLPDVRHCQRRNGPLGLHNISMKCMNDCGGMPNICSSNCT